MINKPFDPTKPVQTRDGRKARIICTDVIDEQPIVACIMMNNGQEFVGRFSKDGRYQYYSPDLDLVNIPQKRWVNLYLKKDPNRSLSEMTIITCSPYGFASEQLAKSMILDFYADRKYFTTVEIDWPE